MPAKQAIVRVGLALPVEVWEQARLAAGHYGLNAWITQAVRERLEKGEKDGD